MALKKSELYSSLWQSCDELRGGMDASQYKDYVLVLLFIKYISDKYADQPYAPITIPPGAGFKKRLKEAEAALDALAYATYPKLTESEIKALVDAAIHGEMDRVSQQLTQRVKELAERYETSLPQMVSHVAELEAKVNRHLAKMGFSING